MRDDDAPNNKNKNDDETHSEAKQMHVSQSTLSYESLRPATYLDMTLIC